jgi:PAS domain S-box-containing protein
MAPSPRSVPPSDAEIPLMGSPAAPADHPRGMRPSRRPAAPRTAAILAGLALLHLTHPLAWGALPPNAWFPPAGIGLALVAWFGPRLAWLIAADGVLVVLQALLLSGFAPGPAAPLLALTAADALLGAAGLALGWWLYHHLAEGARTFGDPRSAVLFLFLVPGAAAVTAAAGHAAAGWALGGGSFVGMLGDWWLAWVLGLMALAPPLLVLGTPWLVRRSLAQPEVVPARPVHGAGGTEWVLRWPVAIERLGRGDAVEIAGLALGATACSLLALFQGATQPDGPAGLTLRGEAGFWHLWGTPLLVIVWASLRQGLRGGTVAAGSAAVVPLLLLIALAPGDALALLVRGNLLAQCATGLLVAASTTWIRVNEIRYRQVVSQVPVVVYSARLNPLIGDIKSEMRGQRSQARQSMSDLRPPLAARADVTLVSAASETLFGCPPEQLLGPYQRWLERVHPEDREVLLAALAQLGRQERPVTCEYRIRVERSEGEKGKDRQAASSLSLAICWVRDTLAPYLDADGRLLGWEGVAIDVTEQRLLANDLRRTTSMLDALVAHLPTGIFFVQGPHGLPLLVNARARQLLGHEDTAAGLEHLAAVYHLCRPDGSPYPVEELPVYTALRRGMPAMRDDIVVHRPDGRRIPLVSWAAPVALRGRGQPDAAVWVFEDMTALHQAEAARRDSEGRLRTVIETMAEGLLVQDRSAALVDANSTAADLLGRPVAQLRGRSLDALDRVFLREDGTPLTADELPARLVLRKGRPVRNLVLGIGPARSAARSVQGEGEMENPAVDASPAGLPAPRSATGEVRWVLVNAMPLGPAPGGRGPAGVVTTLADITASVRAQQMLRASEEKYRGLVEALPLILVRADRTHRVEYANPALRAVTGYALEEVADPQAWARLVHPDDLPQVQALMAEALAGRSGRAEYRYRAKDGMEKVAFALCEPRRQDGQVVGTTMLVVDMTRERRLEQELQRAQRLELVGRLASGIAHDFNNLLTVLLSLTELAHEHLVPDHPVHTDLRRISEAGEQAAALAGQLLAFSKQRRTASRRIAVNCAVRRTLELLRGSLPARIELEARLSEGELFLVADETQFQQVLMNLCLNARDAMPQGGRLRLSTAPGAAPSQENSSRREGPWVLLSVEDEGVGMSEQVKERIFDAFFTTKDRGTGLGLAVVQQIVESYGGRVEVASQPGRGTRFDVWWPAAAGGESGEWEPPAP